MARRLSVYLTDQDEWMVAALDLLVRCAEEDGIKATRADVLREVLRKGLGKYADIVPGAKAGRVADRVDQEDRGGETGNEVADQL